MKKKILFFLSIGIFLGFSLNIIYSYLNYFLLISNKYINPIIISIVFVIIFFIFYIILMRNFYKYLFNVDYINKKTFCLLNILPIFLFSMYLGVLTNIYFNLSFSNFQIYKSSIYTAKSLGINNIELNNINNFTDIFFKNVLKKQNINSDDFIVNVKLPSSNNYGDNFILSIEDPSDYSSLKFITLTPIPDHMVWLAFYNFLNSALLTDNIKVTNSMKISTPYGDF